MQINPTCKACICHESANKKSVCLKGRNAEGTRKLVVFTDYPDYFANGSGRGYTLDCRRILDWLFQRMSVDPGRVAYEYTLRCYAKDTLPSTKAERAVCIEECSEYRFNAINILRPRAIVVLGQTSLEAFTGKTQIGQWTERKIRAWEPVVREWVDSVWVGYSLQYILRPDGGASDTPSVFRILFQAAKDAGLNPQIDPSVPPFTWRTQ